MTFIEDIKPEGGTINILIEEYYHVRRNGNVNLVKAVHRYLIDRTFRLTVNIKWMARFKNCWLKKYIKNRIYRKYGCDIGMNVQIGYGLSLPHPAGVVIGNDAYIGNNVRIYQNVTLGQKNGRYPIIGNNVIIYPSSIVIGPINVGDNSIIGAGAVVLHDIAAGAVVAGNPAHEIKFTQKPNFVYDKEESEPSK